MEKGKYNQEKEKIAKEIKESDLIRKCQRVACLGENIYWKESDWKTHVKWKYEDKSFLINYEDGYFAMGDGMEIKVIYKGNEVFFVYDDSFGHNRYLDNSYIEIGDRLRVGKYIPDSWKKEIDSLLESLSEEEEKKFKENFQLFPKNN